MDLALHVLIVLAALIGFGLLMVAVFMPTSQRPKLRAPGQGTPTELAEADPPSYFWDHRCTEDGTSWAIERGHACNWCGATEGPNGSK